MFANFFNKKPPRYNNQTQVYTSDQDLSWDELRDCLVNPAFRPEVAWTYRNLPKSIDITPLHKTAIAMLEDTKQDPTHRERGTYVKVDLSDKLLIQRPTFATLGTEYNVSIEQRIEGYYVAAFGTISEKIAAIIHTHPRSREDAELINIPSPLDISNMFTDNHNPCSLSLIYTENSLTHPDGLHWLLMRTKDTPQADDAVLETWIQEKNRQIDRLYYDYAHIHRQRQELYQAAEKVILDACIEKNIGVYTFDKQNQIFKRY